MVSKIYQQNKYTHIKGDIMHNKIDNKAKSNSITNLNYYCNQKLKAKQTKPTRSFLKEQKTLVLK